MTPDSGPNLHIDADWKAEAQAEKERLARQEESKRQAAAPTQAGAPGRSGPGGGASQGMPPASFTTLVSTLATQTLFALGAFPDPRTGRASANLDLARHHIDMLGVVEEKTRGNLTAEETDLLASTAYELRSRYIQIATAALDKNR